MIEGLWNGIQSMGAWIWDKISGFCSGIVNQVKGLFGIHSPSRVFREEIGVMLGRGMALGVDDSAPLVAKRVDRLSDVVEGGLSFGANGAVGVPIGGRSSAPSMTVKQELYSLDPDELARKTQQKIAFMLR